MHCSWPAGGNPDVLGSILVVHLYLAHRAVGRGLSSYRPGNEQQPITTQRWTAVNLHVKSTTELTCSFKILSDNTGCSEGFGWCCDGVMCVLYVQ